MRHSYLHIKEKEVGLTEIGELGQSYAGWTKASSGHSTCVSVAKAHDFNYYLMLFIIR